MSQDSHRKEKLHNKRSCRPSGLSTMKSCSGYTWEDVWEQWEKWEEVGEKPSPVSMQLEGQHVQELDEVVPWQRVSVN